MPLFLHRVEYTALDGQLAGIRCVQWAYAHDAEEARAVSDREIFSRYKAENITITLCTQEQRVTFGTLVPRIDQPFNYGWKPEHERGREAYTL